MVTKATNVFSVLTLTNDALAKNVLFSGIKNEKLKVVMSELELMIGTNSKY